MPDFAFYAGELKSEECQCRKTKQRGRSLCYHCYQALPDDMKKDLYQKLGDGYEKAYDDAVSWLN